MIRVPLSAESRDLLTRTIRAGSRGLVTEFNSEIGVRIFNLVERDYIEARISSYSATLWATKDGREYIRKGD